MTIRSRIMLWIIGAGGLTSLLFSIAIFFEMREQPYDILDAELEQKARMLIRQLNEEPDALRTERNEWVRVYDPQGKLVFASPFAQSIDLQIIPGDDKQTLRQWIPEAEAHAFSLDHGDGEDPDAKIPFRVRLLDVQDGDVRYRIQIAKPMVKLDAEIRELVWIVALGLAASILLLFGLSHFVARQILKPIGRINHLAREINEKTLSKRIPLGNSRDELYELSISLNQMFDRLQFSFNQQKQFLASASHELKSPIAILRLFMDHAIDSDDVPVALKRQLTDQNRILLQMDRLIKTLLTLSALELNTTLKEDAFDLGDLIESVLKDFDLAIQDKRITLRSDIPQSVPFAGDGEKLRQVMVNLVDNAIKYGREDGEIHITVQRTPADVRLIVFNTGDGIPTTELERVCEPFYRVEKSRSQRYGGTGLGLSIVQQIIRLHGGRIRLESEPGAWTRVRITLPIKTIEPFSTN
ncbi:Signal transduction histidine kinase [Desulfosarcina cetonica]|uniref:sensor histidine kinase n=1 Tax=Desulfosarcina cetonica TaxID=90730 RepID=UPI0006D0858D|nr:HAMP domain-containing sensor histidine kinase [Desulfosarcina cetonica]VTR71479.1 Signal transduction histidine kinase [Desulfosarcina cetonica]